MVSLDSKINLRFLSPHSTVALIVVASTFERWKLETKVLEHSPPPTNSIVFDTSFFAPESDLPRFCNVVASNLGPDYEVSHSRIDKTLTVRYKF